MEIASNCFSIEREHSLILQHHFKSLISGEIKEQWEARNRCLGHKLKRNYNSNLSDDDQSTDDGDTSEREKSVIISRMWRDAIERNHDSNWLTLHLMNCNQGIQSVDSLLRRSCLARNSGVENIQASWIDLFGIQNGDDDNWLNSSSVGGRTNSAPVLCMHHLESLKELHRNLLRQLKCQTQPVDKPVDSPEVNKNYSGAKDYTPAVTSPSGNDASSASSEQRRPQNQQYQNSESLSQMHINKIRSNEIQNGSAYDNEITSGGASENVEYWLQHQTSPPEEALEISLPRQIAQEHIGQNSLGVCSGKEYRKATKIGPSKSKKSSRNNTSKNQQNSRFNKQCVCCSIM
eukprot:TRINITY_DN10394_c0_g2_i1.p1 TRINITY_DN10394_c0_g2~~TRINITY_DN10394_c0_g2_i1.p1  ORF type:complete len:347 (-),score=20.49 TRINITY_DN10394_c0_g2_i1:744-1784(-)